MPIIMKGLELQEQPQTLCLIRCWRIRDFFENIWIRDSGASCHYCNSHQVLFDVKDISERITVGNRKTTEATKIGSLSAMLSK